MQKSTTTTEASTALPLRLRAAQSAIDVLEMAMGTLRAPLENFYLLLRDEEGAPRYQCAGS